MNTNGTKVRPRPQMPDASAGWWLPRPNLRWAPVSHIATATLISSRALHDHYQVAAVVLLTITAQICDTLKAVHTCKTRA